MVYSSHLKLGGFHLGCLLITFSNTVLNELVLFIEVRILLILGILILNNKLVFVNECLEHLGAHNQFLN